MQHFIGGLDFILIVSGLILILTIINFLSQYQSRKRLRPSVTNIPARKPQAKIIALPRNSKEAPSKVHVKKTEPELV
jgi:hypothetical protein